MLSDVIFFKRDNVMVIVRFIVLFGVWVCVVVCLVWVCTGPVMDWPPVQGVPCSSPNGSWDRLQPSAGLNNWWMDFVRVGSTTKSLYTLMLKNIIFSYISHYCCFFYHLVSEMCNFNSCSFIKVEIWGSSSFFLWVEPEQLGAMQKFYMMM